LLRELSRELGIGCFLSGAGIGVGHSGKEEDGKKKLMGKM